MEANPTQRQLSEAVKKIWKALGGTVICLMMCLTLFAEVTGETEWQDVPPGTPMGTVVSDLSLCTVAAARAMTNAIVHPVTSVNSKTGDVNLTAAEVGALEKEWQDESYGPSVVLLKRTMSTVTSPLFKVTETPGPGTTIYSWYADGFSVPWSKVTGAPAIPTDSTVSGWGYIKSWTETDPTIPAWAKATSKPAYTASDVHARPDDWMPTAADVGAVAVGANGGVATGTGTYASGDFSHAEGFYTTASGYSSHAEGYYTYASGDFSHAEGSGTTASGHSSHAEGVSAKANENFSYSWNGDESTTYNSHGIGTFNLNPLGGLSGLWIGGLNFATILGGYAKRTGETETVDFRNTRTLVKTQLAPVGEDAVNFDMLAGYASSIATTYAPTNALISLNQSVQYVTANSDGSAVEILAPTNSMKDWVVYIYTTTNNAVLFPTGTVYAADATVTNALKPNVVTALYLSSYPAVSNGLIVGRQEMNPIVIVR